MGGDELRALFREVPSPVGVVTVAIADEAAGLTVDSFVPLSVDPPLVGVALGRHAALHELVRESGAFAISVLASDQEHLAQHFARGVPPIAHWTGIETTAGELGAPLARGRARLGRVPAGARARGGRPHAVRGRGGLRAARAGTRSPRSPAPGVHVIDAVVFDLDGVLLDTEELWDEARREIADERGGRWRPDAQRAMMGMSSPEWSRYMHDVIGVPDPPDRISEEVVERLAELYRRRLPLVDGAIEAVRRIGARWPLGIASSSNRPLIDLFLELTGTQELFRATVSSEEVAHGKPAPDVYLEAVARLEVAPEHCAAIEDSENGMRSASSAGMRVVAIPNRVFPPGAEALSLADVVLGSLDELTPETIERA